MNARQWIDAVRGQGVIVELNSGKSRSSQPVLIYVEGGGAFLGHKQTYTASLLRIGIAAVERELRRERLK